MIYTYMCTPPVVRKKWVPIISNSGVHSPGFLVVQATKFCMVIHRKYY